MPPALHERARREEDAKRLFFCFVCFGGSVFFLVSDDKSAAVPGQLFDTKKRLQFTLTAPVLRVFCPMNRIL